MSSNSIVPDSSQLTDPSYGVSAPSSSVNVSQTQPQPEQVADPVNGPSRLNSVLARVVGLPTPTNGATPSASSGGVASTNNDDQNTSSGQRSGWKSALGKVASVVSTGLSGVPAGGRPSFMGGLGQGARAQQQAQAAQQEIKFKDFDTQVRLANLHNQDQELQLRTQEQQDAHQKAQDTQADYDEEHGISYDPHPNDGVAVMDTLQGQTQANGAASVPAGTHLSADGKTVNVPDNSQETAQGLLEKYKALQGPLSLPSLPQNAQFVPGRNLDVMTHKLGGYKADGTPWNHDDLPQQISALQSQRDALAKNGATPYQLQTVDNTIGIMQAQSDALDKHAATVEQQKAQSKKAGEITADMSPAGRALAQSNEKLAEQKQDNAASDRSQGGAAPTPDPFGVTSNLDSKTYNSRYNTFSKAYVQPLTKTDQQLAQFSNIQSDIDKNGNMTGAESVVGLFNAIGISASPLKGMGFRINNNTVEEHANARGLGQSLYQKLLGLKDGDVVTPQQLKDYSSIATQARESQYNSAIDEARRQGLPVDFLPKGNGSQIDPSTAKMYMRGANGDPNKARSAAQQAGWGF